MIVQPLGSAGVLVVGTDTLRGLSRLDQVYHMFEGSLNSVMLWVTVGGCNVSSA